MSSNVWKVAQRWKSAPAAAVNVDKKTFNLPDPAQPNQFVETANNIGACYGAAILTRVVQHMNADSFKSAPFTAPLPFGVMHESFDLKGELGETVGGKNVEALQQEVRKVRELSLAAVAEFYNVNHSYFEMAGYSLEKVLEAAKLHWTELDTRTGARVPRTDTPVLAEAIFNRLPSEPLLDEIIASYEANMTPNLRALR